MAVIAIISVMVTSMATKTSKFHFVDFHTHCLPAVDDGAADLSASRLMLKQVQEQGATAVIATPHFYWGHHTVEGFLRVRQQAYHSLMLHKAELPQILLGAEVLLREGISKVDLRPLCLEGTDILLVELPFMKPPYWVFEELEEIAYTQRLTIMLAHLDRYMPWYSTERLDRLLELPRVIVQINADMLVDRRGFRDLCRWLGFPRRVVLGSDMHDPDGHGPHMDRALRTLSQGRRGREWLARVEETTKQIDEKSLPNEEGDSIAF